MQLRFYIRKDAIGGAYRLNLQVLGAPVTRTEPVINGVRSDLLPRLYGKLNPEKRARLSIEQYRHQFASHVRIDRTFQTSVTPPNLACVELASLSRSHHDCFCVQASCWRRI